VRNRISRDGSEVFLTSHHDLIKLWPFVPVGFLMGRLLTWGWITEIQSGWMFTLVILLGVLMYAFDIDFYKGLYTAIVLSLILSLAMLSHLKLGLPIIGPVFDWFKAFEPRANQGQWEILGTLLSVGLFVLGLPYAFMVCRRRIAGKVIDKKNVGRSEILESISGRSASFEYKDILEMLVLLGGGSIQVVDRDRKVVFEIKNVFCLWFFAPYIDAIFRLNATRQDDSELEVAEELT
jgi:hypothetical protein